MATVLVPPVETLVQNELMYWALQTCIQNAKSLIIEMDHRIILKQDSNLSQTHLQIYIDHQLLQPLIILN